MDSASLLADLRNAALRRDWNDCQAAASALLAMLEPTTALRLARAEVRKRLPSFARQYLGEAWPQRILDGLEAWPDVLPQRPPIVDHDRPGANNFHSAMEALVDAHGQLLDSNARAEKATDAIAGAIMAEMDAQWGTRFPERWELRHRAARADTIPEDPSVLFEMMNDPDIAVLDRESWMGVAEALEQVV